jgi:hypothetical protein
MKKFDAPIPGQSLTNEPRKYPWERPPETSDPDVAISHHLTRIGSPELLNSILDGVGQGMPVAMITDLILTGAVAKGIHSIDISMMIAPVLQDYIVNLLEEEDVEFKEFFADDSDEDARKGIALSSALTGLRESSLKSKGKDDTMSALKERKPEAMPKGMPDDNEMQEDAAVEEKSKRGGGLMSRGGV